MVNQAKDDEESSAACYVETYMDCVENLPNDLQRQLSRMLDLDSTCQKYVREFETHQRVLSRGTDSTARKNALLRVQKVLIIMQDIGDEKLQIMQTIQDLIEKKARQLDIDYKNLKPKLEQENNEPLNVSATNSISSNSKNGTTSNSNGNSSINNNNTNSGSNERQSRRGRRTTRTDTTAEAAQSSADSNVLSENQSSNLPGTSNGKRSGSATNTSSRKNKKRNTSQANQSREESPPKNDDSDENTDEPLYCTCNRVSFGKMIMCDNDSCSLEWFHFSCVNLTTKPKGKWYCPQCRGSRPNIMKSKTQLR